MQNATIHAVIAGVVSEANGGEFMDGAISAVYVYLYNDIMDPRLNGSTGRAAGGNAGISDAQAAQNDATSVNIVLTITGGLSSGGRYVLNALWSEMRVAGSYFMSSAIGIFYSGKIIDTIETLDGYYGGSSTGYNWGSFVSGFENFTGINIRPERLKL